jgi:hypothetical protein
MQKIWFVLVLTGLLCLASLSAQGQSVSFTLRNNSLQSIPLKIPRVMNPNLSPMSNSGVALEVGQEVFFFQKKKKYLLLTVSDSLAGKTLVVNELIRERKQALGLKQNK